MARKTFDADSYLPSEEDQASTAFVFERHWAMAQLRDKSHRYFNDRSLIEYIDDSTKRWNGYVPPRDNQTFDWQARVFLNFTRNTVVTFLSKAALNMPKINITAVDKFGADDTRRAQVLDRLRQWSLNKENASWKYFQSSLDTVVKGTGVVYEGYKKTKRKIREIERYDCITGKVKAKEKEIIADSDCYRLNIPIEDMFFSNIYQSDIQEQDDLIWARRMSYGEAEKEFRKFANWKHVRPGGFWAAVQDTPFYKESAYGDLEDDQVYVMRYYSKADDRMIVNISGVTLYDDPIMFHHKNYPFALEIFEPLGIDFIYGKSLPDKVAHDQDVQNTLANMALDQNFLSIHKPILTQDEDDDEDTIVLVPGLVRKVNDINNYRVLNELEGPSASVMTMMQLFMKQGNDDANSIQGGGPLVTPQGGKVTARQAVMQEETARQTLGLNAMMFEKMELDLAKLRIPNLLQFQMLPETLKEVTGEDTSKLFYKAFRLDDVELSDGTYGTSIIRVFPDQESLPNQLDLDVEAEMANIKGKNVEIKAITPEYIRNVEYDVQAVPGSVFNRAKATEQALTLEMFQAVSPFLQFGFIDAEELFREVFKSFDRDTNKLIKQAQQPGQNPMAMLEAGAMPVGKGTPQVASQLGKAVKAPSLNQLANS